MPSGRPETTAGGLGAYAAQAAMNESRCLCADRGAMKRGGATGPPHLVVGSAVERIRDADFGPMLSQSAAQHGVRLAVSFRPFETALTKYYEIPSFDEQGGFLWSFLPMATPPVNYQMEAACFAHYRTILRAMGHEDKGRLGRIAVPGVENAEAFLARFRAGGDNLRIEAYPPLRRFAGAKRRADFASSPTRTCQSGRTLRGAHGLICAWRMALAINGLRSPRTRYRCFPAIGAEVLDFRVGASGTVRPRGRPDRAGERTGSSTRRPGGRAQTACRHSTGRPGDDV